MKVLIAHDGSEYANAAIADLNRAGLPDHTEAMVLIATGSGLSSLDELMFKPEPDGFNWPWINEAVEELSDSEKIAAEGVRYVQGLFPSWNSYSKVVSGYAESAIVMEAKEFHPDLIVTGSQGRGTIGQFILGSVSLKVLSEAPCSVRVSRVSTESPDNGSSPSRILIALDYSPDSQAAVETVSKRQWQPGSEVRLITAIEPDIPSIYEADSVFDKEMRKAGDLHRNASLQLEKSGLRVSTLVKPGRAKAVILEHAEKWGSHTIFIGAKGHRFKERMLLGSVSQSVAARAHCSVEVVRLETEKSEPVPEKTASTVDQH